MSARIQTLPADITLGNPDVLSLYAQLLAGERFGKRFGNCPVCGRQKFTTRTTWFPQPTARRSGKSPRGCIVSRRRLKSRSRPSSRRSPRRKAYEGKARSRRDGSFPVRSAFGSRTLDG